MNPVYLKSNPVFSLWKVRPAQYLLQCQLSDTEKMSIWQPAPTLKARVNIAPKSKLSHIHSSSIPVTCIILCNQDFNLCQIYVQKKLFSHVFFPPLCHTILFWKKKKTLGLLGMMLNFVTSCLSNSRWEAIFDFLQKNPANHGFKLWITHFRMKECEILVC